MGLVFVVLAPRSASTPFEFTGKLAKLTLAIDRPNLTPADEKRLMEEGQRSNRASE